MQTDYWHSNNGATLSVIFSCLCINLEEKSSPSFSSFIFQWSWMSKNKKTFLHLVLLRCLTLDQKGGSALPKAALSIKVLSRVQSGLLWPRPAQLSGCPWAACSTRLILYWLLSKQINLLSVELCSTSQQSPLICFHYSLLSVVSNLCSSNLKDPHFTSLFCRNRFSGKLINTSCQLN